MNTIQKISFIIVSFVLLSCNEEPRPRQNLFIFFDLSTSLDLENIESQSDKLSKLIRQLPFHSNLSIYTIDLSINQDPIFDVYIPEKTSGDTSDKLKLNNIYLSKVVDTLLVEAYTIKKKNEDFKSCIISSFEMAYNLLPEEKEKLDNTQVVFFTDMIEQCPESVLGSMYMCSSKRKPIFDNILKQVEENYNPRYILSNKLTKDQVHVVITSSHGNQKKCITEDQQSQVWDKILIKQGFDNPQAIYRKSSVPDLWQ